MEDLENSVRQINNMTIEFVLVTGDITEFGDSASLKKSEKCLMWSVRIITCAIMKRYGTIRNILILLRFSG